MLNELAVISVFVSETCVLHCEHCWLQWENYWSFQSVFFRQSGTEAASEESADVWVDKNVFQFGLHVMMVPICLSGCWMCWSWTGSSPGGQEGQARTAHPQLHQVYTVKLTCAGPWSHSVAMPRQTELTKNMHLEIYYACCPKINLAWNMLKKMRHSGFPHMALVICCSGSLKEDWSGFQ